MTDEEKLEIVRAMTEDTESDDDVFSTYLRIAGQKIVNRAYPYQNADEEPKGVPIKYEMLQCEIATYLINKRGADYQTAHSENGVNRTYGSADVPEDMLRVIVPKVRVL